MTRVTHLRVLLVSLTLTGCLAETSDGTESPLTGMLLEIDRMDVLPHGSQDPRNQGWFALNPSHDVLSVHIATEDELLSDIAGLQPHLTLETRDGRAVEVPEPGEIFLSAIRFPLDSVELPLGSVARASVDVGGVTLRSPYDIYVPFAGDANQDGAFDSADLVTVLQVGVYETGEPADWAAGDWNDDGVFSTADLVVAQQGGRYELPSPLGFDLTTGDPSWILEADLSIHVDGDAFELQRLSPCSEACCAQCYLTGRRPERGTDVDRMRREARGEHVDGEWRAIPPAHVPMHATVIDASCAPTLWSVDDGRYGGEHESNLLFDQNDCYQQDADSAEARSGRLEIEHDYRDEYAVEMECEYFENELGACDVPSAGGVPDERARACRADISTWADVRTQAGASVGHWGPESNARSEAWAHFVVPGIPEPLTIESSADPDAVRRPECPDLASFVRISAGCQMKVEVGLPVSCSAGVGVSFTLRDFIDMVRCTAHGDSTVSHASRLEYYSDDDGLPLTATIHRGYASAEVGPLRLVQHSEYELSRQLLYYMVPQGINPPRYVPDYYPSASASLGTRAELGVRLTGVRRPGSLRNDRTFACHVARHDNLAPVLGVASDGVIRDPSIVLFTPDRAPTFD